MLESTRTESRKIERLKNRIKALEQENSELKSTLRFFNERVQILNEKEMQYNRMLEELDVLKKHYQKAIDDTKAVRKKITKELNKYR